MMEQDEIFKALADPSRRKLLDLLMQHDGQTLSELEAQFAESMSRFGVMKHLKVLEEAGLVTTRKVGREKFHYLNTVPIQMVYDRWVSHYAQPWASSLTELKYTLEGTRPMQKHAHVFSIYIRTTPEALWRALTDGAQTQQYYFGTRIESDWQKGSPYRYRTPTGVLLDGEVVEIDPPRKLVTTFMPHWLEHDLPLTRVTFEIEQDGPVCKLTLTHDDLPSLDHPVVVGMIDGWSRILSGLKTLLETGAPMPDANAPTFN
jgi:uncharacterized protein YndB with AHSA1/START domain